MFRINAINKIENGKVGLRNDIQDSLSKKLDILSISAFISFLFVKDGKSLSLRRGFIPRLKRNRVFTGLSFGLFLCFQVEMAEVKKKNYFIETVSGEKKQRLV
ncbi:hypothetical protein ABES03_10275 [Neobacillus rhizosphaerae]|uniref:hypothetical protein n=1 Tax=Neobacillus rhizosphaerae TaxID=2880965 RepID=UPI003D2D3500